MRKSLWVFGLAVMLVAFSFGQAQQQGVQNDDQTSQLPPEQALGKAPFIMGYDIAPPSTIEDVSYGPTNTSLGYKGVVMANIDSADAADELYADFGASGLWYYNNGAWTQVSGLNPQGMISVTAISATDDELIVDFGATGLWYADQGIYWSQLSGANADGMFATDDDNDGKDEIQVDFGTLGVWHFDPDTWAWIQFSGLNPYKGLRMDYWTAGYEEGVWNFPTVGMWLMYTNTTGSTIWYEQLTGTVTAADDHASANFVNDTGAEDLVADFEDLGLWLYKSDRTGWVQVSTMWANRVKEVKFMGTSDYELLAEDLDTGILHWGNWNGTGMTWTQITATAQGPGWCETCDWDGIAAGESEEVFIHINAGGMYRYDFDSDSLTSVLNTLYSVHFAVRGDPYGVGYDSTVALAMTATGGGTPGLYLYDAAHGYEIISGLVPDGTY